MAYQSNQSIVEDAATKAVYELQYNSPAAIKFIQTEAKATEAQALAAFNKVIRVSK